MRGTTIGPRNRSDFQVMSSFRKAIPVSALLAIFSVSCTDGDLRGSFSKSKDGKTYLVIADDGSKCLPVKVDNKVWPYAMGRAGEINPGRHKIGCGEGDSDIEFDIRPGVIYKFDYWGP